jgi:hypothetical protein
VEAAGAPHMNTEPIGSLAPEEQLSSIFGSYKAEWLQERIFDFYTAPAYIPELLTPRPCMLVGGRGTGKTTVLRSLSYEGQFALNDCRPDLITTWQYIGLYYRVNTNRVTAFKGPELTEERWTRTFAHYFNLVLCDLMVQFLEWLHSRSPSLVVESTDCFRDVTASLHLQPAGGVAELAARLDMAKVEFEGYINNVADANGPLLSIQGAPVDALAEAIQQMPGLKGKSLFFLLDEYENFEDYQQQVVNTLIKHAGNSYTFKVGVRELGWRRRTTLNPNEQLISPADYVRINIVDKLDGERFRTFAKSVCNARMARLRQGDSLIGVTSIDAILPGLSEDDEAELQGVAPIAASIRAELEQRILPAEAGCLRSMTSLELFFLKFWSDGQRSSLVESYRDYLDNEATWRTRYGNYKHALLYTLRRGKRGIHKYYAGWDVFTQLAASNIRYLLELVDQSLLHHLRDGGTLGSGVDPKTQTLAAQYVGKKNLSELEGLSVYGAQLTKLVLGLGRVFQTMAADAAGHTPEVSEFHLRDPISLDDELGLNDRILQAHTLLRMAVMHLALIRSPGTKPGDEGDTKDYDYMVHPVFCAFFCFGYRRKRKLVLTTEEILGLVQKPRETIRAILAQQNRKSVEALPEQLSLFEGFFDGGA